MRVLAVLVASALPLAAVSAAEIPIVGWTQAEPTRMVDLQRSVLRLTELHGKCHDVEEIRVGPMPKDFKPVENLEGRTNELWTAVGCGREFAFWVAWYVGPNGSGTTTLAKYRWE